MLYRPTATLRKILTQEARVILPPDPDGPANSHREVQITIPGSPQVYVGIDIPVQRGFDQGGIGPDRNYQLPSISPGQLVQVKIQPQQFIVASCDPGIAYVSLIVEFVAER